MTPEEWFEKATEFYMGICPYQLRPLYISSRKQIEENTLWVVQLERTDGWVLGKDKEWHWEPMPSGRTDEFITNTRFPSPDEAWSFYEESIKNKKHLYLP